MLFNSVRSSFFLFHDTAPTEIYTLSLHDALPIYPAFDPAVVIGRIEAALTPRTRLEITDQVVSQTALIFPVREMVRDQDRKSTRLNSSHTVISYAVFCLKKKKKKNNTVNSQSKSE